MSLYQAGNGYSEIFTARSVLKEVVLEDIIELTGYPDISEFTLINLKSQWIFFTENLENRNYKLKDYPNEV